MNQVNIPWATYPDMVASLAKFMPGHGADLLHSAIGISGEVAELFAADSGDNVEEECGDLEFYIEHGWQALDRLGMANSVGYRLPRGRKGSSVAGYVLNDLVVSSSELLDIAKKAWVYNKPISLSAVANSLEAIELDLDEFYRIHGLDRNVVRQKNMAKLALRCGSNYSDAAAQARKDKAL